MSRTEDFISIMAPVTQKVSQDNRCGRDGLTEDEIHEVDGEDDSPCYECMGYGDDYSFDDNGELVDNCTDCPWNETRCDSWKDWGDNHEQDR